MSSQAGIATVLNYPRALPFYPAYNYLGHEPADFPVAHENQSRILSIPIYPEMADEPVFVVRVAEAQVVAVSAVCTHMRCVLRWKRDSGTFQCPCHDGARTRNLDRMRRCGHRLRDLGDPFHCDAGL